nr:GNAT family N-acetyltransferase [uncultured Catonella sp.]
MKIIHFEESYRDDLIFMILQAKDALGRKPGLNEDLLDIKSHYFDKGGRFWIAIDENDRVIGSIGYMRVDGTNEAFIHRLFVKVVEKHKGLGTALLMTAEEYMKNNKILVSKVHLGSPKSRLD